jgi:hypothetical protein
MNTFKEIISSKKRSLASRIEKPMAQMAKRCEDSWYAIDDIDALLRDGIASLVNCARLRIVSPTGIQLSATAIPQGLDRSTRGQDQSASEAFTGLLPFRGMSLSDAYLSQAKMAPCVSALQAIRNNNTLLGFLAADFYLQDLHSGDAETAQSVAWRQFKGDPSIRGTLFQQQRSFSLMDEYIDETLRVAAELMEGHGVFHVKLHFSSARATFWQINDPFNYRLHDIEECISPDLCLAYPASAYPEEAQVAPSDISSVLNYFKLLRVADDNIYLRSASLNIMNAMVGLTFSCDGSHYMPVKDLLQRDLSFWFGGETKMGIPSNASMAADDPAKAS